MNVPDLTECRRVAAPLHEAEAPFEQVFEHATVAMHVLAADGSFLRVNGATCLMLGYAEQQLLGLSMFDLVHADDADRSREAHRQLLLGDVASYTLELQLRCSDGTWIWSRTGASVVRDRAGTPLYVVAQVEDVTERHRLEERLAYEATHDRLTGLASRALLFEHLGHALARARRGDHTVAVLFIDLDAFKRVNDTLGHTAGDDLLVQVAERLCSAVRGGDVCVRLGGDEFVVCLPEIDAPEWAVDVAERVLGVLRDPYVVQGHNVVIGASIGVALAHGDDPVGGEQLLSNAGVAAHRAKRQGRGRVELFDAELRRHVAERRRTMRAVAGVLRLPRLPLVLTPIAQLTTGVIVGFDARVDWYGAGVPATEDFARVLDEAGMARAVDVALLRTTFAQLRAWEERPPGPIVPGLGVTLDARAAAASDLVDVVRAELGSSRAPASLAWLGIREPMGESDVEATARNIAALNDLGLGVALRDFGAGLSSFGHLRRLPTPTLMLATPLVDSLATGDDVGVALCSSVLRVARTLGRITVAVGVDDASVAARLCELGCDFGTGLAFGPRLTIDDVPVFLATRG